EGEAREAARREGGLGGGVERLARARQAGGPKRLGHAGDGSAVVAGVQRQQERQVRLGVVRAGVLDGLREVDQAALANLEVVAGGVERQALHDGFAVGEGDVDLRLLDRI